MRYSIKEGMLSWLLHRLTGIGIFIFLIIHVMGAIYLKVGPEEWNHHVELFNTPFFRVAEVGLIGAILWHGLNGLRIIIIDFSGIRTSHFAKFLFWIIVFLTILLMLPGTYILLKPLFEGAS